MAMVSIEGAHAAAAREIFDLLDYKIVGTPALIGKADDLDPHLKSIDSAQGRVARIVYDHEGWTHIADPDLLMFEEKILWKELSKRWKTRIVCWICNSDSETYGFALYANGELKRELVYTGGEVSRVEGEYQMEEMGFGEEGVAEDDIFTLIELFGVYYDYMEEDREYSVYVLEEL